MYKILFIDEEEQSFDDIKDYVEMSSSKDVVEVIVQMPLPSLSEMIDCIIGINPDAIITDFKLNDVKEYIDYNVPYNGVELVQEIQEIRETFPCFVLTSFDDLAVGESNDVNLVYIKHILHNSEETKAKASFLDKILFQIDHYRSHLSSAEEELLQLIQKRAAGKATIHDENRIIELDKFLENTTNKRAAIPKEYKTLSNTDRLTEIMNKVDELIKKVDESHGK